MRSGTTKHHRYWDEKKYFCEHQGQTCEVQVGLTKVPEEWIETLWQLYDESLNIEEAIQEQACYTRETFSSALRDPEYHKTVMVVDDVASGLVLMTYNLEKAKVAYINPDYILKHFQKEVEEVRFGYITCVFVSPKIRNLRFFNLLVEACINTIGERDYVLALDVSASRQFIPEALEILSKEYGYPLKKQLLGTQSYFAFRRPSESELREVDKADP